MRHSLIANNRNSSQHSRSKGQECNPQVNPQTQVLYNYYLLFFSLFHLCWWTCQSSTWRLLESSNSNHSVYIGGGSLVSLS